MAGKDVLSKSSNDLSVTEQAGGAALACKGQHIAASLLVASSAFLGLGKAQATAMGPEAETLAIAPGSVQQQTATTDPLADTDIEAALVYYQEQGRVSAAEGILSAKHTFDDANWLSVKVALDALTGASANGAVKQDRPQSFTRPSGNGVYQAAAGELPLDDTFKDTRLQLRATWLHAFSAAWKGSLGAYASREYDYTSMGLNAGVEHDFNQSNTQLYLGSAYYYDWVAPVGGRPVGMSQMVFRQDFDNQDEFDTAFAATRINKGASKQTLDLNLGLTQTLTRYWQLQANYSLSAVRGYMTDAYKVVSRVDSDGLALAYHYEQRPEDRFKQNVFVMGKGALDEGTLSLSYRYSFDDWSLTSHTFESRYRHNLGSNAYWQWQFRVYLQAAASFYRLYLDESDETSQYASADYRLGELTTYTLGLKYAQRLPSGQLASVRLAYYQQRPQNPGIVIPERLALYDQFERLDALMLQFGIAF